MLTELKAVSVNGREVLGWEPVFTRRGRVILPILYVHAQISGQIQSIKADDLRIKDLSMTEKNIILRDVIFTNIHRLKPAQAPHSIKISYEQLYQAIRIDEESPGARTEKQRTRETVRKILEDLKHKGYFESFGEYGRPKTADGVEIAAFIKPNETPQKLRGKRA